MIDNVKLNKAFRYMRREGLIARQSYLCCSSCADSKIASDVDDQSDTKRNKVKGACFYNKQNTEHARITGNLYLSYGPINTYTHGQVGLGTQEVGKIVVKCLEEAGLVVEWNGDVQKRILVKDY